jgi:hypothetical protein
MLQVRLRITELQNDVCALAKTRNWKAVLAAEAKLARLDPQAGDLDGLATKARAELLALARRKGKPEEKPEPLPQPTARKPRAMDSVILGGEVGYYATQNPKATAGAGQPPQ